MNPVIGHLKILIKVMPIEIKHININPIGIDQTKVNPIITLIKINLIKINRMKMMLSFLLNRTVV